jgi:hypothetical protein
LCPHEWEAFACVDLPRDFSPTSYRLRWTPNMVHSAHVSLKR